MIPILYNQKEKEFTSLGLGPLTGIIDIHVYEERNGLFYLEMNYHRDAQNSKNLINGNIIMVDSSPDLQNQKFVINRVTSEAKGTIKVYAEHISQNLTKNLTLKPKVTMTGDAKTALTIWNDNILSDNKFIVYSDITLEKKIDWSITNIKNARQALGGTEGSILDLYGGEYKFDNNFISLFKNRGKDRNVLLSYGKNIVDLIKDEDSEDIVTSIQPYSINIDSESGESELLTLPENIIHGKYIGFYDAPKVAVMAFDDEDIQSVEDLRDKAFEYLYSNNIGQPKFQIDVEYQDLIDSLDYGGDANHELTALCDTIYIDFEKMGVDLVKAKIVKTDYNPIKDKFHSLTIGTINSRFRNTVPTVKTMENFNKSIENRTSEIIAYLGADGSATIFNGVETPTARRINDIWYKPNGDTDWQMFIWDGYRWVMTQDTSIPSEAKLIAEETQKKVEEAEERANANLEAINTRVDSTKDELNTAISDLRRYTDTTFEEAYDFLFPQLGILHNADQNIINEFNSKLESLELDTNLYIAYANLLNIDDTTSEWIDFSTSDSNGREYVGILTSSEEVQPTDPSLYEWIKVSDQEQIRNINNLINEVDEHTRQIGLIESDNNKINQTLTTVSQTQDEIKNKVEQVEVDITSGATYQAINEVKQTADSTKESMVQIRFDLDGKVSSKEYNTTITTINGILTDIGSKADGAVQTATFKETIDGMNSTLSRVENDMAAIANGGRNYIATSDLSNYFSELDTSRYDANGTVLVKGRTNSNGGIRLAIAGKLNGNTEYILSFKYKKTSGTLVGFGGHTDPAYQNNTVTVDGIFQSGKWVDATSGFVADDTNIHTVEIKFTTPATVVRTNLIYIQPNRSNGTVVEVEISELQLREGDVILPWIQAPEDVITRSQISELEQTIDGYAGRIAKTESGVSQFNTFKSTYESDIRTIASIKSDVTSLNTFKNTAESQISTIATLESRLDNVGKKNLMSYGRGDVLTEWSAWSSGTMTNTGSSIKIETVGGIQTAVRTPSFITEWGKKYTISFDFKCGTNSFEFNYIYVLNSTYGNQSLPRFTQATKANDWVRVAIEFEAPYTATDNRFLIGRAKTGSANWFEVRYVTITEDAGMAQWSKADAELEIETQNTVIRTVDSTISSISDKATGLSSFVQQTESSFNSMITSDEVSSLISQNEKNILLTVDDKIDDSKLDGNEIKSLINLSTNGVDISGKFISITGETSISNGVIKTAHIGDAQITDAKIGNLTFNWAKGKTLNAEEVNLINLNANSMTTGTLTGTQGSWNLNSGLFRNGSISNFETRLQYGTMTQYEGGIERLRLNPQGLQFFSKVGTGQHIGMMMSAEYKSTGKHGLTIGHSYPDNAPAFINIGYLNTKVFNSTGNRTYDPYIIFDKWNSISDIGTDGYPIKVMERAEFRSQTLFDTSIDVNDYIKTGAWRWSAVTGLASAIGGTGFKIVDGAGYGFGFGANGTIWKVSAHAWSTKII